MSSSRDEALVRAYEQGIEAGRRAATHETASADGVAAPLSFDVSGLSVDLDDLAPGPDALAREDAARDVARLWVEHYFGDDIRPEMEDALNRLAAAHGHENPRAQG